MAKEEAKAQPQAAPQGGAVNQVTTISQAIHVLVQAADMGRKAGIYDWADLNMIQQAMGVITSSAQNNISVQKAAEAAAAAKEAAESTDGDAPVSEEKEVPDSPSIATEE